MSVIILLLIASVSVALIFLGAFIWSVRNKQFDDDYAPPRRILFDDKPAITPIRTELAATVPTAETNPTNQ
ncbi:MAG TPA: cbb3-type cytochrome oxidase assembly protein CcoS [Puia sp.]|nr:cbb3-type cytochrome oxidase assembly protein CcoS [Puia sp.]